MSEKKGRGKRLEMGTNAASLMLQYMYLTYSDPHMPLAVTEARFSLYWCKDMHYFHSAGNNFLE